MIIYTLILILAGTGGGIEAHPVTFYDKASCEAAGKVWDDSHIQRSHLCIPAEVKLLP